MVVEDSSAQRGTRRSTQREYRRQWDDRFPDCALKPPECFSDARSTDSELEQLCPGLDPARTGPNAQAVRARIARSCAGWLRPPTPEEFYAAIRSAEPTVRQRNLVRMWASEASIAEIILGWAQRAYTIRELVAAMHRADFPFAGRIRAINRWAVR